MTGLNLRHVLVVGGSVLVLLQGLKLVAVLSAIRWILAHGRDFISCLEARERDFSESAYWEVLDRTGGGTVLPLGVLEYRLIRFAGRRGPVSGFAAKAARALLFDFTALGAYVAGYLFMAGAPAFRPDSGGTVTTIAWTSAVLAALQMIAIYAEACVSYARIGSYGLGFHGAGRYRENSAAGVYLAEVKTLVGAAAYSLLIGSLILYFSAGHGARYEAISVADETLEGTASELLTCVYFAIATFFTTETPGAENGLARLATAVIVVQAACALILVWTTATIHISSGSAATSRTVPALAPDEETPVADPVPASRPAARRRSGFVYGFVLGAVVIGVSRSMRRRSRNPRR